MERVWWLAGLLLLLFAMNPSIFVNLTPSRNQVPSTTSQGPSSTNTASGNAAAGAKQNLGDTELKKALRAKMAGARKLSYREVWEALETIDRAKGGCGKHQVWDVYTGLCWLIEHQRCQGQATAEGKCYNREHTWPKSWFGGFDHGQGAETDLFGLFLVDGWANSQRANYPYGEVEASKWTSKAGAKLGTCKIPVNNTSVRPSASDLKSRRSVMGHVKWFDHSKGFGFVRIPGFEDAFVHAKSLLPGQKRPNKNQLVEFELHDGRDQGFEARRVRVLADLCFEPPPGIKGDLARTYFYMSVRYEDKFTCCNNSAVSRHEIHPWFEETYRRWHSLDPVDQEEELRGQAIASWQGVTNPFIEAPELVDRIVDF